ncbi:diguanylate cyclase [Xiamenia xianingshaonis]|uniref:Diguanylate cyclase n=1 Tax=Xiamenia xianingshaonis TaxID=2682776 RepID=A0A9E6MR18_9ACTN|nr:diguanylate cyclase [Xiamenia xianingshaonis]NHM13935.1 diguanylate cyclase [Xiamenia xianingshaonis]QTU84379.1 diguanylate cyclase [Xiamenia xianingshaonis]
MAGYTVIIGSSNATCRAELAEYFHDQYDVVQADTLETFETLLNGRPERLSAVIIDFTHSRTDGFTALRLVRNRYTQEELPAFLVVDDLEDDAIEAGYDAGATDTIERPYTKFALRRITEAIRLHEARLQLQASLAETEQAHAEAVQQQDVARQALKQAEQARREAEAARKEAEDARYVSEQFIRRMPGGLFRYKADGDEELDIVNEGLVKMFGCDDEADLREYTHNSFRGIVLAEDLEAAEHEIWRQIHMGPEPGCDKLSYRIRRKDGEIRWVEDWGRYIVDPSGQAWFYVVVLDITEKIRYQNELMRSNNRLRVLSEMSHDLMFDVDVDAKTAEVFGDFNGRFGREVRAADIKRLAELAGLETKTEDTIDIAAHKPAATGRESLDTDMTIPNAEGDPIWCRFQSVAFSDGPDDGDKRFIGRLLDTHEMMMRQLLYQTKAERDAMTGAYNREAGIAKISEILDEGNGPFSLLFIDLDDFKAINDTYGHPVGDLALSQVSSHLKKTAREGDVVVRFGGDEFAMFLQGVGHGEKLERIIESISHEAYADFPCDQIANPSDTLTLSIGVACTEKAGATFEELYTCADHALYQVKRQGKSNSIVYDMSAGQ